MHVPAKINDCDDGQKEEGQKGKEGSATKEYNWQRGRKDKRCGDIARQVTNV